mmetsp:Transcript_33006/g.60841  ORF Transcript_33006/g.60841 Transcript_33006/m.60841 type:complete len:1006 (+) Transcript_33006:78-3095(+)
MLLSDRPFNSHHVTSIDELPCDDVLLDDAELAARANLQSAGSVFGARPRSRPGTVSAWSSASAPSLDGIDWSTSPGSRPGSRPGTGRFSPEELACFRRVQHTPSSLLHKDMSGIIIGDMAGMMKRSLSEHSSPVGKGRLFRRLPTEDQLQATLQKSPTARQIAEMPEEAMTAKVLEEIYPREDRRHEHESLGPQRRNGELPLQMWRGSLKKAATLSNVMDALSKPKKGELHPMITTALLTPKSHKQEVFTPSAYKTLKALNSSPPPGSPMSASNLNSTQQLGLNGSEPKINLVSSQMEMMRQFRGLLLEKCSNVNDVMDIFQSELPPGAPLELSRAEWRRGLAKLGLELTKEERDALFKQVDRDNSGHVSVSEVQFLLEAAAPVKSLKDLRRRWLAGGFNTMSAPLKIMEEGGFPVHRRLALREFGEALMRVNVLEHAEHMALFNIILDPSDIKSRVTIGDLMCAVATVSPSLLLEDVRDRLLKRYNGSISKAYTSIDNDNDGGLDRKEFVEKCQGCLEMTKNEAEKAFRMIDVDQSGNISRVEFVSAFAMSEPSLFLEDLRGKVQQSFRSIKDVFAKTLADAHLTEADEVPSFTLHRFQSILSDLNMSEADTRLLFELVDSDGNGELTFAEYLKATKQLAPSCAFENLRLLCLKRSVQICESFAPVATKRSENLSFEDFSEMLVELDLASDVNLKGIFDVLDIKHEGVMTISRLIAALQAGGPGRNVRLTRDEQKMKAELEVRGITVKGHTLARDLKTDVRLGSRGEGSPVMSRMGFSRINEEEEEFAVTHGRMSTTRIPESPEKNASPKGRKSWGVHSLFGGNRGAKLLAQLQRAHSRDSEARKTGASPDAKGANPERNADEPRSPQHMHILDDKEAVSESSSPTHGPPRLRTVPDAEIKSYQVPLPAPKRRGNAKAKMKGSLQPKRQSEKFVEDVQDSWGHVWKRLNETSGTDDREDIEKKVQGYYQTSSWRMSHDGALLEHSPSRHLCHKNIRAHHSALFR